jgi:hypothetical protein
MEVCLAPQPGVLREGLCILLYKLAMYLEGS